MLELRASPGELRVGETAELAVELVNRGAAPCWMIALELRLPPALSLLGGTELLEAGRLDPGETAATRLRVRARQTGEWPLEALELTYLDRDGVLHRVEHLRHAVQVLPPIERVPVAAPRLRLELETASLPLEQWASLDGRVEHLGGAAVTRLALAVSGPVAVDGDPPWHAEGRLAAGESARFRLAIRGLEPGENVPLHCALAYRDAESREGTVPERFGVRVEPVAVEAPSGEEKITILLVTANPEGDLGTENEHRDLDDALTGLKGGERFSIVPCPAADAAHLMRKLHAVKPRIVHFAGHATRTSLVLMDDVAGAACVPGDALEELFSLLDEHVECVVLNACESEETALGIARHIPFVIGMREAIHDDAARLFTAGFYEALAAEQPIEKAFKFGRVRIAMARQPGMSTPVLFRGGVRVGPEDLMAPSRGASLERRNLS